MARKNESHNNIRELLDLSDKTAIITGGAAGIGYGCTRRLAEAGAVVIIADYDSERGREKVTELNSNGYKADFEKCDVTKESDLINLVEKAVKTYGGLDIVVNNAGIYPHKLITEMDMETWDQVMNINLRAVFQFCLKASHQIIKQKSSGSIINIASVSSFHPTFGLIAYDTAKAGVVMLTRTLALELAQYSIRVNSVSPGIIQTSWVSSPEAMEYNKGRLDRVPMGRFGKPEEVGNVVLFLASPASSFITGSDIIVDAGWTLT
jgi:NAD(P)-dependent dehydrogenase (short-subunit alcohol dehydrogenase family)